eukprot:2236112-Rhodomonas_salina.1
MVTGAVTGAVTSLRRAHVNRAGGGSTHLGDAALSRRREEGCHVDLVTSHAPRSRHTPRTVTFRPKDCVAAPVAVVVAGVFRCKTADAEKDLLGDAVGLDAELLLHDFGGRALGHLLELPFPASAPPKTDVFSP